MLKAMPIKKLQSMYYLLKMEKKTFLK